MKITLKNTTTRRAFLVYGILSILVTGISVFVLSNLITTVAQKSNEEMAQRNFLKKQELVAQEFSKFLEPQKQIREVLKLSPDQELASNIKTVSAIQATDSLVLHNWFKVNDKKIQFATTNPAVNYQNNISHFITKNNNLAQKSSIIKDGEQWVWRIFFKLESAHQTVVRYGYDINLKAFHNYFATVDQNTPNYIFVFDEKGTCIFHPDNSFIGENIFKISNLKPSDTLFTKNKKFIKRISLSEYLKLDVIRFTKKLDIKGSNWYISVNFPKVFADENVNLVKKYATLIYLITTVMLVFIFYLFARANRSAYLEKAQLTKEKNYLFLENEKISKEKALIQLQQLKEQINPHFLFNSLNSLYMLVDGDRKVAKKFTLNLP